MHGFAINVSTDLRGFDSIVPCGLHDRGVTSLEKLLGQAPSLVDVENRLAHHCAEVLGRKLEEVASTPLPTPDSETVNEPSAQVAGAI